MEISHYKAINKGALIGTFNVSFEFKPYGKFTIRKMSLFRKDGQQWVSFPSEQYEKEGKKKYFSFCIFEDLTENRLFSSDVLALVQEHIADQTSGIISSEASLKAPPVAPTPPEQELFF